jgi:hypothetical protein
MTNLSFVQACTWSALGLGVYKVIVTVVFIVFCLIGGALSIADAVRDRLGLANALGEGIIALGFLLFATVLIWSLFLPIDSPPAAGPPPTERNGEITPVVLIPMIVIAGIAVTITVLVIVRKLKEGEPPEIGFFEIGWVIGILLTLVMGILGLVGRGPFALGNELPQSEETGGGEITVGPLSVGVGPYIGLAFLNLFSIVIILVGLMMVIHNGRERRAGLILSLAGVGCLLFADVPAAAMITNGCPPF